MEITCVLPLGIHVYFVSNLRVCAHAVPSDRKISDHIAHGRIALFRAVARSIKALLAVVLRQD